MRTRIPYNELVLLLGSMMLLGAVTQDTMLPALQTMGIEFGVRPNATQLVLSASLLGIATGQLFYGPLSDSLGRRPAIFLGLLVFILGTFVCLYSKDFDTLLTGRFLQGLGVAAPRVISISIARDLYSGSLMASTVSMLMALQMLSPVFAPSIGQLILNMSGWRSIFIVFLVMVSIIVLWFGVRQAETLRPEYRRKFSLKKIFRGYVEVMRFSKTVWYTVALGLSQGAMIAYVISSPQIFNELYGITEHFVVYFAFLCMFLSSGSLLNSRLVGRFGLRQLSFFVLAVHTLISTVTLAGLLINERVMPFGAFLIWSACTLFIFGMVFGNFSAIAMRPLGHIAGIGAAFVGAGSTFLYVGIGTIVGQAYDGTILPLVVSFLLVGVFCLAILGRIEDK